MKPLVLVIRSQDRFSELLCEAGFEVENLELIITRPLSELTDFLEKLRRLDDYDGLFFTSPAAAEVFVEHSAGPDSVRGKIYVLGDRARRRFADKNFDVVFRDEANTVKELLDSFPNGEFERKRILFVRGKRSLRTIPEFLAMKADVEEVIVYETIAVRPDAQRAARLKKEIESGRIGWVCFFSPSGVEEFAAVFGETDPKGLSAAAIGETTAQCAKASGFGVKFISKRSNAEDFARGLIAHIRAN